jgi:porin
MALDQRRHRTFRRVPALIALFWTGILVVPSALAEDQDTQAADQSEKGQVAAAVAGEDSQGSNSKPVSGDQISGPSSVSGQASQDARDRARSERAARRQARKDEFEERYGLSLHGDYNALYQHLGDDADPNAAFSGVLRFSGIWTPFHRTKKDSGSLIFKVENRHKIGTDIPNQTLLLLNGAAGISGATFSDAGNMLTNLYWTQTFFDNRFAFNLGVVDVTDYIDVFGLINIWTDYNNMQFSTSLTSPLPNQSLGGVVRFMFTPNYYMTAGIADANGDPHHPEDYFDSFFDTAEYFEHVEVGWIKDWASRYTDNIHLIYWHQDERTAAGTPSGDGATLSFSRLFAERWLGFVRGGYADGGGTILSRFFSAGAGLTLNDRGDWFGFGAGWGRAPGADGTGSASRDQYTFETYYRWQPVPDLQIVPSVQYILDPALDPTRDNLWLVGLRIRVSF